MNKRMPVFVFSCFCIFSLLGCAMVFKKEDSIQKNPALLEPSTSLKFSDVPVPAGFKLLPQNSYSFESSGVRVGVLKYQGKASPEQVISFYNEQMPMYNWNLLNVVEYGERLMNFERENETCIISLLPKRSTVLITLSVGPKPQIPKKSIRPLK
jgi:hypothetical protein